MAIIPSLSEADILVSPGTASGSYFEITGNINANSYVASNSFEVRDGSYVSTLFGDDLIQVGSAASTTSILRVLSAGLITMDEGQDTIRVHTNRGGAALLLRAGSISTGLGNDSLLITNDNSTGVGLALDGDENIGNNSDVDLGDGNDAITITANLGINSYASSLQLGSGSDSITITGIGASFEGINLDAGSLLDTGAMADKITITGEGRGIEAFSSSLLTGSANDSVAIVSTNSTDGAYFASGASFEMEHGNDLLEIDADVTGLYLSYGAVVDMGDGNDTVNITGGDGYGIFMSAGPLVLLGDGNDQLVVTASGNDGTSLNTGSLVDTGDGNDTFETSSISTEGLYMSSAQFNMGDGNDKLIASSENDRGIYMDEGVVFNLGSGNNVIVASSFANQDGIYLDSSAIFAGAGNDRLQCISKDSAALDLSESQIGLGRGQNRVEVTGEVGLEMTESTFIAEGGNDTIIASSDVASGGTYDGIFMDDSAIALGGGANIVQASSMTGYGIYLVTGTLATGRGNDTINAAGAANDNILSAEETGIYMSSSGIKLGEGNNTLSAVGYEHGIEIQDGVINTGNGIDVITGIGETGNGMLLNDAGIYVGGGNDSLTASSDGSEYGLKLGSDGALVHLGPGDNNLKVSSASGNAALITRGGILGGNGIDTLEFTAASGFGLVLEADGSIKTGAGNDQVKIMSPQGVRLQDPNYSFVSNPTINLGIGNDTFLGGRYSDSNGVDGYDLIIAGGTGQDTLLLSDGDYTIANASAGRTGMIALTDIGSNATQYLSSFELIAGSNGLSPTNISVLANGNETLKVTAGALTIL